MKQTSYRVAWFAWALIIGLGALGTGAQAQINWHESWEAAQQAALVSHKLVLVYLYQPSQSACVQMANSTYSDPRVAEALQGFECAALNGKTAEARPFCEKYGVGVRSNTDRGVEMDFSAIPGFLFLESDGREYFRAFGWYPAGPFLNLLEQVGRVTNLQRHLLTNTTDARASADLGRLYLEMGRDTLGKPFLQKALQLDPRNVVGAKADAELDLIILSIPDDPQKALQQLANYRFAYPTTKRRLEINYYIAVAQIASGNLDQAERTLHDFATMDPKDPEYRSPWAVRADLLLKQLKTPPAAPRSTRSGR